MAPNTSISELEEIGEFDRLWKDLETTLDQERQVLTAKVSSRAFPTHLTFGQGGNAATYQLFGWNHPEQGFTWTEGAESLIELPKLGSPSNHFLNVYVAPFLNEKIQCQRVQVKVGEVAIAEWEIQTAGHFFALLPGYLLTREQELSFHFGQSKSPAELGLSDDNRELALRFFQLWLTPWRSIQF